MAFYYNIALLIYWSIFAPSKNIKTRNKIFVFFATTQWILLSGLRHLSIGADTASYLYIYNGIDAKSWDEIYTIFFNTFNFEQSQVDGGYYLFVKITQIFTNDYQNFLMIVAVIFTVPLGYFIYNNSSNVFISYLLYSVMFYSFFSITGIRQAIATALVVLIGYEFIKKRQLFRFVLIMIIAFTFHKSALIFSPFYFIKRLKLNKNMMILTAILFFVSFYFRVPLTLMVAQLSGYDSYGIYEGAGTFNFTLLLVTVFGVSIWKMKTIISRNKHANDYYLALCIALLLTPLTWVNPSAMRSVQYFSIFLMLLIPDIIKAFDSKEQTIGYFLVISVLLFMFIRSNPQYYFYWEYVFKYR